MKYERDVLCPSCGAVIDHWLGNTEEPDGMVGAMLFQESRQEHGSVSPKRRGMEG